jgi:hypothetical protein
MKLLMTILISAIFSFQGELTLAESEKVSEPKLSLEKVKEIKRKFQECNKSESKDCYADIFEIPLLVHAELFLDSVSEKTPLCKMKDSRYLSSVEEMRNCLEHPELQQLITDCLGSESKEDMETGHAQNKSGSCEVKFKNGKWKIHGLTAVGD